MNETWDVNQKMIDDYNAACLDFIENDNKFNQFKQDPRYTIVLEHVGREESELYISEMKGKERITESVLKSIKENDTYGSPTLYDYDFFGSISPSTIRYVKNSLDILDYFGEKTKFNRVLEIGGGYGGLCSVFHSFVKFKQYYLVDLPNPNMFSKKYLDKFSFSKKINYMDTDHIVPVENLDLVISNYAFSECSKVCQNVYYHEMIRNSKNFYMVYNNFTTNNMNVDEFIKLAFDDFEIFVEEETRSSHMNYILYGKKK